MFKKPLRLALLGSLLTLSLSACASQLPGSGSGTSDSAFALLSDNADGADPTLKNRHHRGKKGHHGMMMGFMMRGLDLTDTQKAQFQDLMKTGMEDQSALKAEMKTFKESVKAQFLSDNFDANRLQAEWEGLKKPDAEAATLKMATKLHTAWNILTPEQQTKIEARLQDMEDRINTRMQKSGSTTEDRTEKKLAHLSEKLDLTAAQQATLKSRWEAKQGERQDRHTLMKQTKQQVLAQLKSGASVEALAETLSTLTDSFEGKSHGMLSRLAELHDILTPEQRQKLVDTMQKHRNKFRRGHAKH